MLKVVDYEALKTININGSEVVIRPLRPNQSNKVSLCLYPTRPDFSDADTDEAKMEIATRMAVRYDYRTVDGVTLAKLIESGVVSIGGHEDKPILETLLNIPHVFLCSIGVAVVNHTGLDEEEVANLPSSSEQVTQGSPASVTKTAKAAKRRASGTKKK